MCVTIEQKNKRWPIKPITFIMHQLVITEYLLSLYHSTEHLWYVFSKFYVGRQEKKENLVLPILCLRWLLYINSYPNWATKFLSLILISFCLVIQKLLLSGPCLLLLGGCIWYTCCSITYKKDLSTILTSDCWAWNRPSQ